MSLLINVVTNGGTTSAEGDGLRLASGMSSAPIYSLPAKKVTARNPALDFTKGVLVVIMVLYHWFNYFISTTGSWYRYLRFLTPSFIFITGFFVSHIYLAKYEAKDSRLPKRLVERGLKLIAIFVALNFVIHLLVPVGGVSLSDWSVYVFGNTAEGRAAFSILLPIGYLLVLCGGLSIAVRFYRHSFHAACIVVLLMIWFGAFWGFRNTYLELVGTGLLGVSVGYLPMTKVRAFAQRPYLLLLAYFGYLCAITMWHELFALQIVGVCLSLALIYALGDKSEGPESVRRAIVLLGQYSLLGYIAQIVILQILRRLHFLSFGSWRIGLALGIGLLLTFGSAQVVDIARKRVSLVNRLYSLVFA